MKNRSLLKKKVKRFSSKNFEDKLFSIFQIAQATFGKILIPNNKKIVHLQKLGRNTVANWDSLNHIKFILDIEKKFKIKINEKNFHSFDDFKSIANYLINIEIEATEKELMLSRAKSDFLRKFKKLKINKTKNIYVTANLLRFIRSNKRRKSHQTRTPITRQLDTILDSLKKTMGKECSIFAPAATLNLCNTKKMFDVNNTPSHEMGILAEHIRKKKSAIRSIHPYWSVVGIGKNSRLLKQVSKHSYGIGSPWSAMLDLNSTQLNLGLHPSKGTTLIHHIETCIGVPYRFNKEYKHKIKIRNKIYEDKFYMAVRYKKVNIKKKNKLNEHFFKQLNKMGKLNHQTHISGLDMWSFNMRDFYNVLLKMFKKDIYTYLERVPNLTQVHKN